MHKNSTSGHEREKSRVISKFYKLNNVGCCKVPMVPGEMFCESSVAVVEVATVLE